MHLSRQNSVRNIQFSNNKDYQELEISTLIGLGWSLLCPIIFKAPGMRLVRTACRNVQEIEFEQEVKILCIDRYAKRGSMQKLQRLFRSQT